ncbi:MAG: AmmeMemoRadiSam system protein B [Thiohalobacterales bacterium]
MGAIRQPAVAGSFYPADQQALVASVDEMLQAARTDRSAPRALIVPHAGYIYSGPVAATGYACLRNRATPFTRVILLGPAHHVAFRGLAVSSATAFATPLGDVQLDQAAIRQLVTLPQVRLLDAAHQPEHSLEVHLPFLQRLLGDFTLVPLVVGEATAEEVSKVLEILWNTPDTLVVVSSDLSHYHSYATATRMDRETSDHIERLEYESIEYDHACGRTPVSGLLYYARSHDMTVTTLDLRNSGDTAGPKDRVVGYGTYLVN